MGCSYAENFTETSVSNCTNFLVNLLETIILCNYFHANMGAHTNTHTHTHYTHSCPPTQGPYKCGQFLFLFTQRPLFEHRFLGQNCQSI